MRRPLVILILSVAPAAAALAQGVYRVLFADLAVVNIRLETPAAIKQGVYSGAPGREFSLEIAVDNLGDLPAHDTAAELRIYLSSDGPLSPSRQELSPLVWQAHGVVFLSDARPPRPPYLNSLQRGVFVARGLRLPGRSGTYIVTACIVFPDGVPFGENEANNCSDGLRLTGAVD